MKNNLKKARDLFSYGKYNEVLRLLEPLIFEYSESKTFFYYLGYSCLYVLDFHGAQSYFTKLLRIAPGNIDGLLGLAIIHVKRGELKDAASMYLRVLEYDRGSKEAKAGLKYLKLNQDEDRVFTFFDNGKFVKLLPKKTRKRSKVLFLARAVMVFFVFVIALGTAGVWIRQILEKPTRPELQDISINDIASYRAQDGGSINLEESEIKSILKNIYFHIDEYRDNRAQYEINTLLLSNATAEVKERARVFQKILKEPKLNTLTDNFSYEEVSDNPQLYHNCYVVWTGRAANINITQDKITFSLLVGYEDGNVLKGVVPAYIEFSTEIFQNMPVELLAQIESDGTGVRALRVVSIHRLLNSEALSK